MNRLQFLLSLIPLPLVPVIKPAEETVMLPQWILDSFGNEDQICIERYYHDSEYLFPELDHTLVEVNNKKIYPWKIDKIYPAYRGTMYRFKLDDEHIKKWGKAADQHRALQPSFSR